MPVSTHVSDNLSTDSDNPSPAGRRCHGCGETIPDGYCDTCVDCDRCGDPTPHEDTTLTVRGSTICTQCISQFYWQCLSCDGWNRDDDDCANDCGDQDDDLVHDYSYRPSPIFHGNGPLFLGPEIEVETWGADADECARIATSHLGDLGYLKEDSSLDNGFEIVAHPMSYDWAMKHFPWEMLNQLRESGCCTPATTGIHVHVSRDAFAGPSHTYRWMKFIYRNQRQVTTLARRSSPNFAAFSDNARQSVKNYAKGASGERYQAINPNNPGTFELRVFASSLQPAEVKAAFAFAAASVEYTRTLTVTQIATGAGWTWQTFVTWLAERPTYAPLTQQLEVLQCVC